MTHEKSEETTHPRLGAALAETYDEERRTTPPPSLEEILAHLEGELDEAGEEEFQERLALHPEASRRLLELQDPPPLAENADLPGYDPEPLRQRLAAEGLFDPPGHVVPFPDPRRGGVHPAYRWAAAALLLLSLGLSAVLLWRTPAPTPIAVADVAMVELLPRDDSGRRGDGEELVADPAFVYDLLLWADEAVPEKVYRLSLTDAAGREVLRRDLRTNRAGRVVLRLAADDLEAGRYVLRLLEAGAEEPFAIYDLDWSPP